VHGFVLATMTSEAEHLHAFTRFVGGSATLLKALRAQDWVGFASHYNGPGYAKNGYERHLKIAYDERMSKRATQTTDVP
jgi:hypothetical protein